MVRTSRAVHPQESADGAWYELLGEGDPGGEAGNLHPAHHGIERENGNLPLNASRREGYRA